MIASRCPVASVGSRALRLREFVVKGTVLQAGRKLTPQKIPCQGTTSVVPISTLLKKSRAGFAGGNNLFLGFFSGLCRQKPSFLALSTCADAVCEGPDVSLRRVNAGPSTASSRQASTLFAQDDKQKEGRFSAH